MRANFIIDEQNGYTYTPIPFLPQQGSTFHSGHFTVKAFPAVTNLYAIKMYYAQVAEQVADALDELEWDTIVENPRIRQGLRRLAAEALRQEAAGETEEGGFAIE